MSEQKTCQADACNVMATSHQYIGEDGALVRFCRIHRQMLLFNAPFRFRGMAAVYGYHDATPVQEANHE